MASFYQRILRSITVGVVVVVTSGCELRAQRADPIEPDAKLTPGATFNVPIAQLIVKGYANKIGGGVRNVSESTKKKVFIEYFGFVPIHPGNYEIDHLISLEIGGSNDIKNLWPESYKGPWNSRVKDRLEDHMAALLRKNPDQKLLRQLQHEISSDWVTAYKKYLGHP
jgi:hypothetical protein